MSNLISFAGFIAAMVLASVSCIYTNQAGQLLIAAAVCVLVPVFSQAGEINRATRRADLQFRFSTCQITEDEMAELNKINEVAE